MFVGLVIILLSFFVGGFVGGAVACAVCLPFALLGSANRSMRNSSESIRSWSKSLQEGNERLERKLRERPSLREQRELRVVRKLRRRSI